MVGKIGGDTRDVLGVLAGVKTAHVLAVMETAAKERLEPVANEGVDSDETGVKHVIFRDKTDGRLYKASLRSFGLWMIGKATTEAVIAASEPEPFRAAVLREKTGKFSVW